MATKTAQRKQRKAYCGKAKANVTATAPARAACPEKSMSMRSVFFVLSLALAGPLLAAEEEEADDPLEGNVKLGYLADLPLPGDEIEIRHLD